MPGQRGGEAVRGCKEGKQRERLGGSAVDMAMSHQDWSRLSRMVTSQSHGHVTLAARISDPCSLREMLYRTTLLLRYLVEYQLRYLVGYLLRCAYAKPGADVWYCGQRCGGGWREG
eukprot:3761999-Rhodomonas_salina.1